MRLRTLASTLAAAAAGLLLLPALATAAIGSSHSITLASPDIRTATVASPSALCFDQYSKELYVSSRSTTNPGIYAFKVRHGAVFSDGKFLGLPPGAVPQDMEFGTDGSLWVIDNGRNTIDEIRPGWTEDYPDPYTYSNILFGAFVEHPQPPAADNGNGLAFGFRTDVLENAGNADTSQPGSAFFGQAPNFPLGRSFGDTIFPNGVDLLPGIHGLSSGRLPSEFLFYDAQNNDGIEVTDTTETPTITGTFEGPGDVTGATPGTDLSTIPVDVNPRDNGAGTDPFLVPVPGLGQIFESTAPGKPWQPLLPAPAGRPVRVDSSCNQVAWTDFTNNQVSVAKIEAPKKADCDDIFNLIALGAGAGFNAGNPSHQGLTFVVGMAPALDAKSAIVSNAKIGLKLTPAPRAARGVGGSILARKVKSTTEKARLRAGKLKKVKLKFSRREAAAIFATLQRRHRVNGSIKIRLKSPAGEKTTVKRRFRIKSG
jgi:hypothetical protein